MSVPVRSPNPGEFIEHVSFFDHLGREVTLTGLRGGQQTIASSRLPDSSLRLMVKDSGIELDSVPAQARPDEGNFGARGDDRVKRRAR